MKKNRISLEEFLNEISLVADVEEAKDNKDVITTLKLPPTKTFLANKYKNQSVWDS